VFRQPVRGDRPINTSGTEPARTQPQTHHPRTTTHTEGPRAPTRSCCKRHPGAGPWAGKRPGSPAPKTL
jgi:hypothetical protein